MGFKDWGNQLRKAFGVSQPAPTPTAPAASPEIRATVQQLEKGTHRQYSPGEIRALGGYLQQIKDITQTNMLAMGSLMQATPKPAYKDADGIRAVLQGLGGGSWDNTVDALGSCVLFASQLDKIQQAVAKNVQAGKDRPELPVIACERDLVIGIAGMAQGACNVRRALVKQVAAVEAYLDVPQLERIKRELAASDDKIIPLLSGLTTMTIETLGKAKAENAPRPQV